MSLYFFAFAAFLLAVLSIAVAAKLLLRGRWFKAWLKGCFGFLLLAASLAAILFGWDLLSYKQALAEQRVGTLSFQRQGQQRFLATLTQVNGRQDEFQLAGDSWQLDARFIKLNAAFIGLGLEPGLRLERISGRFYSLEQERQAERTVYEIQSSMGLDSWYWLNRFGDLLGFVDTRYGSATFLPMADGAVYEIKTTHGGLMARPLNERARSLSKEF